MFEQDDVPTIDDYRRGVRYRWKLIAVFAVVIGCLGAGVGLLSGETWKTNVTVENDADAGRMVDLFRERMATADAAIITDILAEGVRREMSSSIEVTVKVEDDHTLSFTVVASSTQTSRAAANEIVDRLIELRRAETLEQIEPIRSVVDDQIAEIDDQIAARNEPGSTDSTSIDNLLVERSRLRGLQLSLGELATTTTGGIRTTGEPATLATSSLFGLVPLTVMGLILGAGIGLTVALMQTFFDRTVRTRRQLARVAPSVPTLAVLARGGAARGELLSSLPSIATRQDELARHTMLFAAVGKTENAANVLADLATTLANQGRRVVVIDADSTGSRVSSPPNATGDVPGEKGGMRVIAAQLRDAGIPKQQAFAELLEGFDGNELVLVSTSASPESADAAILGREVDATVLVVPFGSVSDLDVSTSLRQLTDAGCRVAGFVLDDVPAKDLSWASAGV